MKTPKNIAEIAVSFSATKQNVEIITKEITDFAQQETKPLKDEIERLNKTIVVDSDGVTELKEPKYGMSGYDHKYTQYDQAERITLEEHNKRLVAHVKDLYLDADNELKLLGYSTNQLQQAKEQLKAKDEVIERVKGQVRFLEDACIDAQDQCDRAGIDTPDSVLKANCNDF